MGEPVRLDPDLLEVEFPSMPENTGPSIVEAVASFFSGADTNSVVKDDPVTDVSRAKRKGRMTKEDQIAEKAEQAIASTNQVVLIVDGLAQRVAGPNAAINIVEWNMIKQPIADYLAKSPFLDTLEKTGSPIMLMFGLSLWGSRIYQEWRIQHPRNPRKPKEEVPAETRPPFWQRNGHSQPVQEQPMTEAEIAAYQYQMGRPDA